MYYSKVPPLRNCVIRNSGLIFLNKIPPYKKLSTLIQPQFLLERYIVTLHDLFCWICPHSWDWELFNCLIRLKKKGRWTYGTYEQHEEIILYFESCFLYHCTYTLYWRSIFSHKKQIRLFYWNKLLRRFIICGNGLPFALPTKTTWGPLEKRALSLGSRIQG